MRAQTRTASRRADAAYLMSASALFLPTVSLVPEMAHAGEDHRKTCFIGGRDHIIILD